MTSKVKANAKSLSWMASSSEINHFRHISFCLKVRLFWIHFRLPQSRIILEIYHSTSKLDHFVHIPFYIKVRIQCTSKSESPLKSWSRQMRPRFESAGKVPLNSCKINTSWQSNIKITVSHVTPYCKIIHCKSCRFQRNLSWEEPHLIICVRGKIVWRTRRKEARIVQ